MSTLQHDRIKALAVELRLTALPDIYGAIAQAAAKRKDASYADFLEEVLRAERDARRVRAREMLTRTAGFPAQKTLESTTSRSPPVPRVRKYRSSPRSASLSVLRTSSCSGHRAPARRTLPSPSGSSLRIRAGRSASCRPPTSSSRWRPRSDRDA